MFPDRLKLNGERKDGDRELDSRDRALVAAIEQNLPARGRSLAGERGFEGRKIETCELYIELGQPGGIGESAGGDSRLDGLRHLQVQPIEPFQAISVGTSGADAPQSLKNVRNRLRSGLDGGEQRSVVREHVLFSVRGVRPSCYWLNATPLNTATPTGLEVATGARSP